MDVHAAGNDTRTVGRIDFDATAGMCVIKNLARRDIHHQAPSFLEQLKSEEWIRVLVELQRSPGVEVNQAATAGTGGHPISVVDCLATLRTGSVHEHLGS
jgi:hypothetical protein